MKHLLWLFTGWLMGLSDPASAQSGLLDGYIINLQGDTVRGRIDYQDWIASPRQIRFMQGETAKTYQPNELNGFFVNGDTYRSYRVHIAPYSQDPSIVVSPNWHSEAYDTVVFLRLVTGGRLNLYYYRDPGDVTYFFIQCAGKVPEQLQIRNRVIQKNGGAENDVVMDDLYQYQLSDWVGGCSAVAARPVRVAYEENALRQLITTYNHCGAATGGGQEKRGVRFHFLLMAGYERGQVTMSPRQGYPITNATFSPFNGPTGGLGLLAQLPRAAAPFALTVDALFGSFTSSSNKWQKDYYETLTGKLAFDEVKVNVQFRYTYPSKGIRPYVAAGVANSLVFNDKSYINNYDASSRQNLRGSFWGDGNSLQPYRLGFVGTVGVLAGRWNLEGRYEKGQDLMSNSSQGIDVPVSYFYAMVGFKL
jgi:hypothetical protein